MKLQNTSPLGDLDIVGVGRVEAGAEFDAEDESAADLIEQGFEPVGETTDYQTWKVAALRAEIHKRNEDRAEDDALPDAGKKADLVAVLTADDAKEE